MHGISNQFIKYYKNSLIEQLNDITYHYEEGRLKSIEKGAFKLDYHYDSIGRLSQITSDSGFFEEFTYDKDGRILKIRTNDKSYKISYDNYGNPIKISISNRVGPVSQALCKYDTEDRLTEFRSNEGHTVNYAYDARGNLISEYYPEINVNMRARKVSNKGLQVSCQTKNPHFLFSVENL